MFEEFRRKMNDRILEHDNLQIRRFFALDERVYEDGDLPATTKELLGLVASAVLRCDDCVSYHLIQCKKVGFSDAEIMEALSVALIVGGSIVIPHLRRAVDFLAELEKEPQEGEDL
jgi:AhpD family alkylhydroperoxidase